MLTLLHTAQSNVEVFDALLKELAPEIQVRHLVDEAILHEARAAGAVTPKLIGRVGETMHAATQDAEFVLCTCSTIGGLAEEGRTNVLRVDRPMAEKAISFGSRIVIAATLRSTLEPTKALVASVAKQMNRPVQMTELFIESAWPFMERGDKDSYARDIAHTIERAVTAQPFDAVILAQASMAVAEPLCAQLPVPVLSSPRLGVEAALAAYRRLTITD